MKTPNPRRPGVPSKPVDVSDDALNAAEDIQALDLMGRLLDLGITPDQAASAMTTLAKHRHQFVTQLVEADKEWTAEREAAASQEDLPDFLQLDNPAADNPNDWD
jgi:hypothetical protein